MGRRNELAAAIVGAAIGAGATLSGVWWGSSLANRTAIAGEQRQACRDLLSAYAQLQTLLYSAQTTAAKGGALTPDELRDVLTARAIANEALATSAAWDIIRPEDREGIPETDPMALFRPMADQVTLLLKIGASKPSPDEAAELAKNYQAADGRVYELVGVCAQARLGNPPGRR